jgi:hypothetical protein
VTAAGYAEHEIAADRRRQQPDQRGRDRDDDQREQDVGAVEVEGFDEIVEAGLPVARGKRGDQRIAERVDEQRQHHQDRRRDQQQRQHPVG